MRVLTIVRIWRIHGPLLVNTVEFKCLICLASRLPRAIPPVFINQKPDICTTSLSIPIYQLLFFRPNAPPYRSFKMTDSYTIGNQIDTELSMESFDSQKSSHEDQNFIKGL